MPTKFFLQGLLFDSSFYIIHLKTYSITPRDCVEHIRANPPIMNSRREPINHTVLDFFLVELPSSNVCYVVAGVCSNESRGNTI